MLKLLKKQTDQTYTTTAADNATEELLNIDEKSSSAAAFNYAETSQKAIESAKYFGSNLLIKYFFQH